ncbi:MAG: glycosylhydrolase-like jelly roll fold domain-containing protein, partial [Nitrososphaerales archaeon]
DRTVIPLHFAPKQSWFVVFRRPDAGRGGRFKARNIPTLRELATLSGPWEVSFDEKWGGPARVIFEHLEDWTRRPEEGIRYYSGMATYRNTFDAPRGRRGELYLDLGEVKNVARVRLNGKELGVVWTAPWRVAVGDAVKATGNQLEIDVVNLWPNRLIGDGLLPKGQRRTKTNVRLYDTPLPQDVPLYHSDPEASRRRRTGASPDLLSSGLLGPVKLIVEVRNAEGDRSKLARATTL